MSGYTSTIKSSIRWIVRDGEKVLQQARECIDLERTKMWIEWVDVPLEVE